MRRANALEIRNHLGAVLDELTETGEPILVSKGRELRAVLITPEDYQTRFVDKVAESARDELKSRLRGLRKPAVGNEDSLTTLRKLRGYAD